MFLGLFERISFPIFMFATRKNSSWYYSYWEQDSKFGIFEILFQGYKKLKLRFKEFTFFRDLQHFSIMGTNKMYLNTTQSLLPLQTYNYAYNQPPSPW